MSDVSVIGLGAMGSALAAAFLDHGLSTTVWNRSAERADALVAKGAILSATVADALAASKMTVVCLLNYDIVHEAAGPAGDALSSHEPWSCRGLWCCRSFEPGRANQKATGFACVAAGGDPMSTNLRGLRAA